jgi:cyclophilin family peptidyl-prolyl cis-trans isomerase
MCAYSLPLRPDVVSRECLHGQGPFTLELYWNEAPRTCRNFYELVRGDPVEVNASVCRCVGLTRARRTLHTTFSPAWYQARRGYYNNCKFHRVIRVRARPWALAGDKA